MYKYVRQSSLEAKVCVFARVGHVLSPCPFIAIPPIQHRVMSERNDATGTRKQKTTVHYCQEQKKIIKFLAIPGNRATGLLDIHLPAHVVLQSVKQILGSIQLLRRRRVASFLSLMTVREP